MVELVDHNINIIKFDVIEALGYNKNAYKISIR